MSGDFLVVLWCRSHINHNKGIQNEVAGAWFAWIFMLIMLIFTGIYNFINVHWFQWHDQAQYRVDDPNACTTAWHRILTLWWADQLRTKHQTPHKRTCSLWTLHDHCIMVFILQLFNWDLIPYFEILPFPWWNNHNK